MIHESTGITQLTVRKLVPSDQFHLPERFLSSQLAVPASLLSICIVSRENPLLLAGVEPEHPLGVSFKRSLAKSHRLVMRRRGVLLLPHLHYGASAAPAVGGIIRLPEIIRGGKRHTVQRGMLGPHTVITRSSVLQVVSVPVASTTFDWPSTFSLTVNLTSLLAIVYVFLSFFFSVCCGSAAALSRLMVYHSSPASSSTEMTNSSLQPSSSAIFSTASPAFDKLMISSFIFPPIPFGFCMITI